MSFWRGFVRAVVRDARRAPRKHHQNVVCISQRVKVYGFAAGFRRERLGVGPGVAPIATWVSASLAGRQPAAGMATGTAPTAGGGGRGTPTAPTQPCPGVRLHTTSRCLLSAMLPRAPRCGSRRHGRRQRRLEPANALLGPFHGCGPRSLRQRSVCAKCRAMAPPGPGGVWYHSLPSMMFLPMARMCLSVAADGVDGSGAGIPRSNRRPSAGQQGPSWPRRLSSRRRGYTYPM